MGEGWRELWLTVPDESGIQMELLSWVALTSQGWCPAGETGQVCSSGSVSRLAISMPGQLCSSPLWAPKPDLCGRSKKVTIGSAQSKR